MTYYDGGLLETFEDARQNVHSFTYDEWGRLWTDSDPAGGEKTLIRTGEVFDLRDPLKFAI
jgi:YD repeat-containing protein